ncbi:MAG: type II secretion system GspH family protein [Patescibacteria group bacterium]|nr:type II secretion system GspH family protein [Patescibacteria group bacterium]
MVKFVFHNKSFTLIELVIYLLIMSSLGILTMLVFYGITFYSNVYLDKILLRNEMFNLLYRLHLNSIIATSTEVSSSSIKFNLNPEGYERFFLSNNKIYFEDQTTSTPYTSDRIKVNNFEINTTSNFYHIFIKLSDRSNNHSLSLTTTLYLWSF